MAALDLYHSPRRAPLAAARRLGALLGLPDQAGRSDVALADAVAGGLPVATLDRLAEVLGRSAVIGPVVPETTYRRAVKSSAPFSREVSDRIYHLGRVVDAVARVYHADRAAMRRFLEAPHPLLEGRSPLSVATASAAGADAVVTLVESAEAGFPI
jgi:putative toxin-antitoxin system antitoxin component (TIGR02293 family)